MPEWLKTQAENAQNFAWAMAAAFGLWLASRGRWLIARYFTNQKHLEAALKDIEEAKAARAATNQRLEEVETDLKGVGERLAKIEGILSQIAKS